MTLHRAEPQLQSEVLLEFGPLLLALLQAEPLQPVATRLPAGSFLQDGTLLVWTPQEEERPSEEEPWLWSQAPGLVVSADLCSSL